MYKRVSRLADIHTCIHASNTLEGSATVKILWSKKKKKKNHNTWEFTVAFGNGKFLRVTDLVLVTGHGSR